MRPDWADLILSFMSNKSEIVKLNAYIQFSTYGQYESTAFQLDSYNNKFGIMMDQEEFLPNQSQQHHIHYLIDNLLQQPSIEDSLFASQRQQAIQKSLEQEAVDSDNQLISPLSVNMLEKQQRNSFPPQRFFEYVGDEAFEKLDESEKAPLEKVAFEIKKSEKASRLSYLEEARAAKIQRYKSKKSKRIWNHKVSYDCRKIVADNRARVNGRFVKKPLTNVGSESINNVSFKAKELQVLRQFNQLNKPFQAFNL